jgi:glycosyltransferase involved in cell wall biosynthesis
MTITPSITEPSPPAVSGLRLTRLPLVEVAIPVHNEERALAASVTRLLAYLETAFPFPSRITIVDNASADATWDVARDLAARLPAVSAIHLGQKGRGRALRAAWSRSSADVLCYMDVDLSTGLDALLPLVAPLASGHSDIAIGSRLARGARVERGPKRELISRGYNLILRATLRSGFSDAQCGFKAITCAAAHALLPAVADDGWFFDTELLVLAERSALRIHEVPVDWVEDPDSRVDIVPTAIADLRGVWRMLRRRDVERQVGVFAAIGLASTVAYLALYTGLRAVAAPIEANTAALLVTAVLNTAANRRLTFGLRGRHRLGRHHAGGLAIFGVGLAITSAALTGLDALVAHPGRAQELAALTVANAVATLTRFALLRSWVFRDAVRPTHTKEHV